MGLLLALLFLGIPLLEIWVLIRVGEVIGAGWTVLALVALSIAGGALVKWEGPRAWARFRAALAEGRLPTAEVVDGALVLFGGALLLTPGFLTDALGLALLIPPTRAVANRLVRRSARRRVGVLGAVRRPPGRRRDAGEPAAPRVFDVEVVDVRRNDATDHGLSGELDDGGDGEDGGGR